MLSNKDFAAFTSTGDGDQKVRFDFKQIREWDKQNAALHKKRAKKQENESSDVLNTKSKLPKIQQGEYRDRALERRSEVNADDDMLEIVARLNPDQTKFLGGDMEHTHLVKGLDYALLNKNRAMTAATVSSGSEFVEESVPSTGFSTALGAKLSDLLFPASVSSIGRIKPPLSGISFEFNFADCFQDCPSLISKGHQELDRAINSAISEGLIHRVREAKCAVLHTQKRRKVEPSIKVNTNEAVTSSIGLISSDDIYGGIVNITDELGTEEATSKPLTVFGAIASDSVTNAAIDPLHV